MPLALVTPLVDYIATHNVQMLCSGLVASPLLLQSIGRSKTPQLVSYLRSKARATDCEAGHLALPRGPPVSRPLPLAFPLSIAGSLRYG